MSTVKILYEVKDLPIFQNRVFDTQEEAKNIARGDMCLVEDLNTGLIYNQAFRSELVVYDELYDNEQSTSSMFQKHLNDVLSIIERIMGKKNIVEVGCGKGYFLEMMQKEGFDVQGYDPTYQGSNPRVIKEYFAPHLGIKGDGLVVRHVLEHVQDPVDFLKQLGDANGNVGKIYIEVPCLDWLCENNAWFDVFYEHVNYFRLSDFHKIFGKVYESGRLFGGQYLYVLADLSDIKVPEYDAANAIDFALNFPDKINFLENNLIIWGGGSKGVIFSLLMMRANTFVDKVIDINPRKQNKYLPITGLKVNSPEDAIKNIENDKKIYVMNPNYVEEVQKLVSSINSKHSFKYATL